jgi:hypothetical protein
MRADHQDFRVRLLTSTGAWYETNLKIGLGLAGLEG